MVSRCDNKSVGLILQNEANEYLLINRAKFPYGWAAIAGHIDKHGSPEQAAITEAREEVGAIISIESLKKVIDNRRINNICRRPGGDHHDWTVFIAEVAATQLALNIDEVRGAGWFSGPELQQLADQTPQNASPAKPSGLTLENIWRHFLTELDIISRMY